MSHRGQNDPPTRCTGRASRKCFLTCFDVSGWYRILRSGTQGAFYRFILEGGPRQESGDAAALWPHPNRLYHHTLLSKQMLVNVGTKQIL